MEMRRSQEQLRTIRADRDRQAEYRAAVGQQYSFLSDYLQEVSDSLLQRKDPPKAWYHPEVAASSAGISSIGRPAFSASSIMPAALTVTKLSNSAGR